MFLEVTYCSCEHRIYTHHVDAVLNSDLLRHRPRFRAKTVSNQFVKLGTSG